MDTANKAIAAEISERKAFLAKYGEEIPENFLPQLDILPRKMQVLKDAERDLPSINVGLSLESIPHLVDYQIEKELAQLDLFDH